MSEESDAQLAHEFPWLRREKTEEMNTAVCVNAVPQSSTILLTIVINKLGQSDSQGFIYSCRRFPFSWTISRTVQAFVWTVLVLPENKLLSHSHVITRPQRYTVD